MEERFKSVEEIRVKKYKQEKSRRKKNIVYPKLHFDGGLKYMKVYYAGDEMTYWFEYTKQDTILDIKKQIEKRLKIEVSNQFIVLGRKILKNEFIVHNNYNSMIELATLVKIK